MDFFDRTDTSSLIDLNGRIANFKGDTVLCAYPENVRDFGRRIINELYLRNFDVPGIESRFMFDFESGAVSVTEINVPDSGFTIGSFDLNFGNYHVSLYNDGSGSIDQFIGESSDYLEFNTGVLHHRKMNGKNKIHLHYSAQRHHAGFTHHSDYREHDLDLSKNEQKHIELKPILENSISALEIMLRRIMLAPLAEVIDVFDEPEHIALNNQNITGPFYGFRTNRYRTENVLTPSHRLVSLGQPKPLDHPLEKYMNEGFVYMETEFASEPTYSSRYNYALGGWGDPIEVYEVNLKNCNGIYVIDGSVFDMMRDEYFNDFYKKHLNWKDSDDSNIRNHSMSDELVNEYKAAEVATMVHFNDYKGGYKKPLVISTRRICSEEMKLVSNKKLDFYIEQDNRRNNTENGRA